MARYSTTVEDIETMECFSNFQEIIDSPRNTQKPETNLLASGHLVRSESEKDVIFKEGSDDKNNP